MPLFGQLLSWESNLKCMTVALFLSKREKRTKQRSLVLFSVGHLATFILHFPWLLLKPKEIHSPPFMFVLLGTSLSKAG